MDTATSLAALLHLLVFAYWLGGDAGVFYSSFLLTDSARSVEGRLAAGKILADVDLVPRFALLAALPTGLLLAAIKGWIDIAPLWIAAAFATAAIWAGVVWRLHHRATAQLGMFDRVARIAFMIALLGAAAAGFSGFAPMPLFIAAKILLLAFCILMGLLVRAALTPFAAAYGQLAAGKATADINQVIERSLARARPAVMMIWAALLGAALLGVATPV